MLLSSKIRPMFRENILHVRRRNCTWALDFRWWWYLLPTLLTEIFPRKLACLFFHWQYSTSTIDRGRKSTNFRTIAESTRVYSFCFRLSPPCPRFTRLERGQARKTLHPSPSHSVYCIVYFIGQVWWIVRGFFCTFNWGSSKCLFLCLHSKDPRYLFSF